MYKNDRDNEVAAHLMRTSILNIPSVINAQYYGNFIYKIKYPV